MNEPDTADRRHPPSVDLDADLATLAEERDFLLRSLRDLEAERDAEDIDDVDYQTLRDDYTVRAAGVLRAIEHRDSPRGPAPSPAAGGREVSSPAAGEAEVPSPVAGEGEVPVAGRPGSTERRPIRWRLAAVATGVALFGGGAIWALTATSGSRVAGQSITGNSNLRSSSPASPAVDPRLAQAATLVNGGKMSDALKVYDQILHDTANQPAALANSGWLIAQAGLAVNPQRPDLVDEGLRRIVSAEQAAPSYPDPHFFRGFLLLRAKNDPVDAVTELRNYLGSVDPSQPQVPAVEQVLQQAIAAAGPNVPAAPNAPGATSGPTVTPSTLAPAKIGPAPSG